MCVYIYIYIYIHTYNNNDNKNNDMYYSVCRGRGDRRRSGLCGRLRRAQGQITGYSISEINKDLLSYYIYRMGLSESALKPFSFI